MNGRNQFGTRLSGIGAHREAIATQDLSRGLSQRSYRRVGEFGAGIATHSISTETEGHGTIIGKEGLNRRTNHTRC